MSELLPGIIGIAGVLVGIFANEFLRRTRRIEIYSTRVFEIRLEKYNCLIHLLHDGYHAAVDVMENDNYTSDERHTIISEVIYPIANFADENELYIDSDLAMHCVATFMGAEDIYDIENPEEKVKNKRLILDAYNLARNMIKEDSGVERIDKLFKKITKPNLSGPIIERIQYLRKHPEALQKIKTPEC